MVKLTIFSNEQCKSLGFAPKNQHNNEAVVNTRIELCGGHLNEVNFTLVNYTKKHTEKRYHVKIINKLGLSSAKLSRAKFGYLEVIFKAVSKDSLK